jgi:cytochrome c oxidase cbb3-type subunit 4
VIVDYATVAKAVQQGGTLYFIVIFLAGCAYAFWPKKKAEFDAAARLPLEEDA